MKNNESQDNQIIKNLYGKEAARELIGEVDAFERAMDGFDPLSPSGSAIDGIKAKLASELNRQERRRSTNSKLRRIAALIIIVLGITAWSTTKSWHAPRSDKAELSSVVSIWQESSWLNQMEESIAIIEDDLILPIDQNDAVFYADDELYDLEDEIKVLNTTFWKG